MRRDMKIVRRKDRVIGWECGETGRPGGRPLRVHGKGGQSAGDREGRPYGQLGSWCGRADVESESSAAGGARIAPRGRGAPSQ